MGNGSSFEKEKKGGGKRDGGLSGIRHQRKNALKKGGWRSEKTRGGGRQCLGKKGDGTVTYV